MREIKCRGFSLLGKKWFYGSYFKSDHSSSGHCILNESGLGHHEVDQKSVGQYTGLKDKNGVEIYEGDILALDNENERGSYHIYKIKYNADKARFVGVDGGEISCMPSIVNHHDGAGRYMVVGNIYENPDLLKAPN